MAFAIQTWTLFDGWVNTSSDGEGKPIVYLTRADAEADLLGYEQDVNDAYKAGDLSDPFDKFEHRIVEV